MTIHDSLIQPRVTVQILGYRHYVVYGEMMFCGLCKTYDGMHQQSKSKIWNETPYVRYRPQTVSGHFF